MAEIPPHTLAQLNAGCWQTANLVEWLAVDMALVVAATFPALGWADEGAAIAAELSQQPKRKTTRDLQKVAKLLVSALPPATHLQAAERLGAHTSDLLRNVACYVIGLGQGITLAERLQAVRPLAADAHFGVRETAWLAIRPHYSAQLPAALTRLQSWAEDPDENIRRFAVESTRPRGVWTQHLAALKADPEPARPLLEAVMADPSKYVQDAAGNWLNDAAKTRPDWVRALADQWRSSSDAKHTARILKRGLRSL